MQSLRGRLTVGVVLVLAAVVLVAGLSASRYVDHSERAALDDRLERTAELSRATAIAAVNEELPENDRRLDAVLSATGTSLRLLLGGRVLLDTGDPPPRRPKAPRGLSTQDISGVHYRTYVTRLRDADLGGLARLEVTTSLASLERQQRDLQRRLLALGLLSLALAAAACWFAADRVLRPVRRLRAVASSIAADEDLSRRVPPDVGATELRSLAASFNAMLGRLGRSVEDRERALAATQRFAADAGHELRTPLTAVQATLSTLARHPELPTWRRAEMAQDALGEQRRLVALLDGLQALARGDVRAAEREPVDLAEVADAAVGAAAGRHPRVHVVAHLPEDPVVVDGWEPGLRLIADNLVENAARHGRRNGEVHVALSPDGVLTVDDDGTGIPEEERERIFEPFARVEGNGRSGSGLGLALVSQQARLHGTRVNVSRSPLGGARFSIAFRASGAQAQG